MADSRLNKQIALIDARLKQVDSRRRSVTYDRAQARKAKNHQAIMTAHKRIEELDREEYALLKQRLELEIQAAPKREERTTAQWDDYHRETACNLAERHLHLYAARLIDMYGERQVHLRLMVGEQELTLFRSAG